MPISPPPLLQTAAALVEAERAQLAEVQGVTQNLKADNERRARVFNDAVRAAVFKVQEQLEAERDTLQARWVVGG